MLNRILTKNYSAVPLFRVDFDLNKFTKDGSKDSCNCYAHPTIKKDEYVIKTINDLVDYIREKYDMENLSK